MDGRRAERRSDVARLGERIRSFRQLRGVSLRDLGQACGLSAGFLSQLERGLVNANVESVGRIASALGMSLQDLFDFEAELNVRVVRHDQRVARQVRKGVRRAVLAHQPFRQLEAYVSTFEPGASTGKVAGVHGDGVELLLVLAGDLTVQVGDESVVLRQGDSAEFRTSMQHRMTNEGASVAELMWVASPPAFHSDADSDVESQRG